MICSVVEHPAEVESCVCVCACTSMESGPGRRFEIDEECGGVPVEEEDGLLDLLLAPADLERGR